MIPKTALGQEVLEQLRISQLPPYSQEKLVKRYLIRCVKSGTADEMEDLFEIASSENIKISPDNSVSSVLPDDFDPNASIKEIFTKFGPAILKGVPTGGLERIMQFSDFGGGPDDSHTLLHIASSQPGNEAARKIEILVSHGARVDAIDRNLMSPLDYAAEIGNVDSVGVLVKADPQPREYHCHLSYIEAAKSHKGKPEDILEILRIFKERGDDPNLVPNDDWGWRHRGDDKNALMAAAYAGFPDRVEVILQNPKTDPNKKRLSDQHTTLDLVFKHFEGSFFDLAFEKLAQQNRNRQIALLIIGDPRFDPKAGSHRKWLQPYLYTAIILGESEIVENLIKRGADIREIWGNLNPLGVCDFCLENKNNTTSQLEVYQTIRQVIMSNA